MTEPVDATPQAAEGWLAQWAMIGGGVTLGVDRKVHPWRFIPAGLSATTRQLADSLQTELLRELEETPGLAAAVRVVASHRAGEMFRAGVKGMGKEQP